MSVEGIVSTRRDWIDSLMHGNGVLTLGCHSGLDDEWLQESGMLYAWAIFAGVNIILVIAACTLTLFVSPEAAGGQDDE